MPEVDRSAGVFSSRAEAAVARDLALMWRQRGLGASLDSASEAYNFCVKR